MASILDLYNTSGFYRAPVTKGILGAVFSSHVTFLVPAFSHLRKYLVCQVPYSFQTGEYWRFFACKFTFLDSKEAILALILLYKFRLFERRYGSRKFASQILVTFILTACIEFVIVQLLTSLLKSDDTISSYTYNLAGGPFGLILPLFLPFYLEVPRLNFVTVGGLSVSSKSLFYILGLQLTLSSLNNFTVGVSSIVAALLYHQNFLYLSSWFKIPKWLSSLCDKLLGWIVNSNPPEKGILGATLEIQRTLHMEALDEQLMRQQLQARARQFPAAFGQLAGRNVRQQLTQGVVPAAAAIEPSEENANILMAMGFSRERVLRALRESNNNVEMATAILLQDV